MEWSPADTVDFFENRFSPDRPWVKNYSRPALANGEYWPTGVRFWASVRARARELYGRQEVEPGVDYAITEVVRCKSKDEKGVWAALDTCSSLYLQRTLKLSGAKVIVVLGSVARSAMTSVLKLKGLRRVEPWDGRFVTFLSHPNARGEKVLGKVMPDELPLLRRTLMGSYES